MAYGIQKSLCSFTSCIKSKNDVVIFFNPSHRDLLKGPDKANKRQPLLYTYGLVGATAELILVSAVTSQFKSLLSARTLCSSGQVYIDSED